MKGSAEPVFLRARNQTRGRLLCSRLEVAYGMRGRGRGLMGRRHIGPDEGMLFTAEAFIPVMWMHTFFMAFPIDIVFLDRNNVVVKINAALRPWRFSSMIWGARRAIELSSGAADRAQTAVGDLISFEESEPFTS
jgi:uncharacterized protein